jgi:hypothetical protein
MRRRNRGALGRIIAGGILLFIGMIFTVVGVVMRVDLSRLRNNGIQTTAEIYNLPGDSRVYLRFTHNSQEHIHRSGFYSSGMRIGGTRTIYFMPDDPSNLRDAGMGILVTVFILVGIFMLILGILLFVISFIKLNMVR